MPAIIKATVVKFSNAAARRYQGPAAGLTKHPQPVSRPRQFLDALLSALAAQAA